MSYDTKNEIPDLVFWRIYDNKVNPYSTTKYLGWNENEGIKIAQEFLDKQIFCIMRTCHGLGDWGQISAMPRLLKQKYPDCKVLIPTTDLIKKLFDFPERHPMFLIKTPWVTFWNNPWKNCYNIFKNNPYIDGFYNETYGEIIHDHFRIYKKPDEDCPIIEQMLRFWNFSDKELEDSIPELYFTQDEIELGDEFIKRHGPKDEKFGCLLISHRANSDWAETLQKIDNVIKNYKLPLFYSSSLPLDNFSCKFLENIINLPIRLQLYIRSKAVYNIGNQSGVLECIPRYSKTYVVPRGPLHENYIRNIKYI